MKSKEVIPSVVCLGAIAGLFITSDVEAIKLIGIVGSGYGSGLVIGKCLQELNK